MSQFCWERLNNNFHSSFLGQKEFPLDPNWNKRINSQVEDIYQLHDTKIIDAHKCLDYACGDGRLIERLNKLNPALCGLGFDKYTEYNDFSLVNRTYQTVISTSFFEHVRHREDIDIVNRLIDTKGVLALHTLVCENVPKDPSWFYLVPVHSIVYTNKSMQILFNQWGYRACIYNPSSRMWFWFKEK
jgi:2-polyprenyl-3-methyl-5-hydroxy-6-metoxy-1,4-benzoquinol methylase